MAYTLNPFSGVLDYYEKGTTSTGTTPTDHGDLTGLSNDDHPQYHNNTRGDARYYKKDEVDTVSGNLQTGIDGKSDTGHVHDDRYYTENEVDTISGSLQTNVDGKSDTGHTHDSRYYTETEHINSSAGAGDAGKPVVLDVDGNIDASMINDSDIAHGSLTGKDADDHTQYILVSGTRAFTGTVGGITPVDTAHLTTKGYVDSLLQGLDWQESVLDRTVVTSASETLGYRYIATTTQGAWTIHHIYEWNGSSWNDATPTEGFASWVEDEDILYTYNGSSWVKFGTTVTHDNLNAVDGGTYRHLSAAQVTDLTDNGDCSIHKHGDLYYTETELNNGQLDTRYYTEAEVDTISGSLSTEIDSDISTHASSADHDGRYYTESEVDALTWLEEDITDLDKYTQVEINTISGSLQTNIDGKSDTGHTHTEANITDLDHDAVKLRGRDISNTDTPNNGESITWNSAESEWRYTMISGGGGSSNHSELNELDYASSGHTGFQPAGNFLTDTEFSTYSGTLQTQIDEKSDIGHTHDDRYYTETEVDTISGTLNDKISAENLWGREGTTVTPHNAGDTVSGTGSVHSTSEFGDGTNYSISWNNTDSSIDLKF